MDPIAGNAAPGSADEEERRDAERERMEQMELFAEMRSLMRRSGVILGVFIALVGWYFSREWGVWFLVGGVALGALIGGGLAFSGALGGMIVKKYLANQGEKRR